jgi:hypothetical protein
VGSGRRPVIDVPTLEAYAKEKMEISAKSLDKSDIIKMIQTEKKK